MCGVGRDLLAVKGWLQQAPPFLVARFLTRDESITDEFPEQVRAAVANKAVLSCDENFADELRVIYQVNAFVEEPEGRNRPVLAGGTLQKLKGARERSVPEEPEHFSASRPGWYLHQFLYSPKFVTMAEL
jgi:hypothetical protein